MKQKLLFVLLLCIGVIMQAPLHAQGFLKKLKDKVEKKAEDVLDKKIADKTGTGSNGGTANGNPNTMPTTRNGRPMNTAGEGLKNSTVPDVLQQITDADLAYSKQQFGEARFSIQQALLGVELQIGKQLLASLPLEVAGLPKDSAEDRVMSTRYGWANLSIQRVYQKDDQQLSILIGNNSMYAGALDMYFGFAATQSNGETQNTKQIRVKGNKAIIQFEEREGYTVLMQLGTSGMITFKGINFNNEKDMMDAVQQFDIDSIKKTMGEQ
ncbi:hypothetical protein [Sediminibacterium goheungense]|uniref:DUF4251 domain-containing protein n=1 Tax=Sediminibacterium goheungense TaxID=1086393 RepID=A0A4R6IWB9_9BACT|nr:hypothetical protein [Sediminibacterium goheungense]TDO27003.1 hypothetical protein BC659_2319 [Sediminibacterium goheungense]